jgi:hypothetical protein
MAQLDWRSKIKSEMIRVFDVVFTRAKLFLICDHWVKGR